MSKKGDTETVDQAKTDGEVGATGQASGAPVIEFTPEQHEQINAIVARQSRKAAEKAAKEREDAINAYLASQKEEADRAEMEEIDRVKAELADARKAAEKAEEDRVESEKLATVTSMLYRAKVNVDVLDDAIRLVDTSSDDIAAEIDSLKERIPSLFINTTAPPATGSLTPGNDHKKPGGKSAQERARERAIAAGIISNNS